MNPFVPVHRLSSAWSAPAVASVFTVPNATVLALQISTSMRTWTGSAT
ncbi:hypothetical protein LZG04_21470 [Saccharothrix sp. S26]|nr:hypothetical protein [Saccharothrix sp. S26]MCE6997351.1 hypothetical protein [Saccharothrix sp. S26]